MNHRRIAPSVKYITKKCAFCDATFYAKRNTALYCCNGCKGKHDREKKETQKYYYRDPNKGVSLPSGTIPSWEMPESKLYLTADLASILEEIKDYLPPEQLITEKEFISKLKPYCDTHEWSKSSDQIFTEEYSIEVFWVKPDIYKLYIWPWGEDNPYPF